ncbi:unnamed protein product [Polarella glacialis]|uniref:Uncharacterized protein n=1 Tax=Polarella glacialis TaxID=89957 RepID=A0A813FP34_POLGL|nr:unnamed protein product [Polarella glacialis]
MSSLHQNPWKIQFMDIGQASTGDRPSQQLEQQQEQEQEQEQQHQQHHTRPSLYCTTGDMGVSKQACSQRDPKNNGKNNNSNVTISCFSYIRHIWTLPLEIYHL